MTSSQFRVGLSADREEPSPDIETKGRLTTKRNSRAVDFSPVTSPTAKRKCLPQFDVEEMIIELQGPNKAEEKARILSSKGQAAIDILDSIQEVTKFHPLPYSSSSDSSTVA
jgi:hypothetical protein